MEPELSITMATSTLAAHFPPGTVGKHNVTHLRRTWYAFNHITSSTTKEKMPLNKFTSVQIVTPKKEVIIQFNDIPDGLAVVDAGTFVAIGSFVVIGLGVVTTGVWPGVVEISGGIGGGVGGAAEDEYIHIKRLLYRCE